MLGGLTSKKPQPENSDCGFDLIAYIYSLLGHTASSWDVLQETNLVLWAKRKEFERATNFRAWAHTVARFQVMAFLRDKKREPLSLLTPEILEKMEGDNEGCSVGEQFDERLVLLSKCVERLSPTAKKIVRWHYAEKVSLQDIGERLSMNTNAVKQALFRTRRALQNCIEINSSQS